MKLKVIVPTHIWEFKPIIEQWNFMLSEVHSNNFIKIETFFEQGDPPSGRNVRQKYTDLLANVDCYVHFLDCDNLISPQAINSLYWISTTLPKIIMFGQKWHTNGIKRLNASPDNCVPCRCDLAQLFLHSSFLKGLVWTDRYENDGDAIQWLHQKHADKFTFINEVDVWYNALKPHSTLYNGHIITIA